MGIVCSICGEPEEFAGYCEGCLRSGEAEAREKRLLRGSRTEDDNLQSVRRRIRESKPRHCS